MISRLKINSYIRDIEETVSVLKSKNVNKHFDNNQDFLIFAEKIAFHVKVNKSLDDIESALKNK